jgi:hypothetical protein
VTGQCGAPLDHPAHVWSDYGTPASCDGSPRGERYGAGPDAARDARVAARRKLAASAAGRALERLMAEGTTWSGSTREKYQRGFIDGYRTGYRESEEHHRGHYGVPAVPEGGE